MATYQISAKARHTNQQVGVISLVISIPLLIWGYNATVDDEWYSKLIMFFGLLVAYVAISSLLSKLSVTVDEKGIAEKGHVFPWDNWVLAWDDITSAQVLSTGIKLEWQKKVKNFTAKDSKNILSNYNEFEKIVAEIKVYLEKSGKVVTEEKSSK